MLEFEGAGLLASLLVSGVGFVFFSYGKKMARPPQLIAGLALFVFPYFVDSALAILAIGALIVALVYFFLRLGW